MLSFSWVRVFLCVAIWVLPSKKPHSMLVQTSLLFSFCLCSLLFYFSSFSRSYVNRMVVKSVLLHVHAPFLFSFLYYCACPEAWRTDTHTHTRVTRIIISIAHVRENLDFLLCGWFWGVAIAHFCCKDLLYDFIFHTLDHIVPNCVDLARTLTMP